MKCPVCGYEGLKINVDDDMASCEYCGAVWESLESLHQETHITETREQRDPPTKQLTREDIRVGAMYRAKKPKKMVFGGEYNDRYVLWIGERFDEKSGLRVDHVQYDSVSVRVGRYYPYVTMVSFLKWASHEVKEAEA